MRRLLMCVASIACVVPLPIKAECQAPGLIGEYFSLDDLVSDFPLLPAEHRPGFKRVDANIDFNWVKGEFYGTPLKERFYVRWSGWIKIPKSGQYTFYTESDDGSRLFIDDREIVDNYGLHGMQEEEGSVSLKSGRHRIQVDFIQYDGGAGCICRWQGPKVLKEVIPESALSHPVREEHPLVRPSVAFLPHATPHPQPAEPADAAMLDEKVQSVLPLPQEEQWLTINWRRNLHAARLESQIQGKPIFLWVMNGNPAGCT